MLFFLNSCFKVVHPRICPLIFSSGLFCFLLKSKRGSLKNWKQINHNMKNTFFSPSSHSKMLFKGSSQVALYHRFKPRLQWWPFRKLKAGLANLCWHRILQIFCLFLVLETIIFSLLQFVLWKKQRFLNSSMY